MPRPAAPCSPSCSSASGRASVDLPVEAVYPFEDARAAVAASAVPGRAGKILLRF